LEGRQMEKKDQERTRMEFEEKRREAQQAQRERDSLKVEMDESRYVIGQLTAEVTDLRSKVAPGMRTAPHNISPLNVQVPLVPPPQVQRSGPPPMPLPQGNLAGPPMSQHPFVEGMSQQHERDEFFRAHAQSPGVGTGMGAGPQFPPAHHGLTRQGSAGGGGGGGPVPGGGIPAVVPAKPVGVYSNRAGRLFAM
jgi:hypothetical protein